MSDRQGAIVATIAALGALAFGADGDPICERVGNRDARPLASMNLRLI